MIRNLFKIYTSNNISMQESYINTGSYILLHRTTIGGLKNLLVLVFATVFSMVDAQNLLTPSKNSFDKKWVKSTGYQMVWYALNDTTKFEMGRVSTQISTDKKNLIITTQVSLKNMKAPWIDSTVADIKSLKPIRHSSYNMQRDMVLNFGKVVTGFYNDKMQNLSTTISDTTRSDYFDSNLYPFLIGWLPLAESYKQVISIYDYSPNSKKGVIKATIEGVTSGIYRSDKNGIRNVWIVTVSDEISTDPNTVTIFYFDKTDRKLWKQEMTANGRKMMMKSIE